MKTCAIPTPAETSSARGSTLAEATADKMAGRLEKRGMVWVIGAFVFCPCHLPITLGALALVLGGTAAGVALRAHPFIAGAVVTLLWAAGTWRGFHLIRSARSYVERT